MEARVITYSISGWVFGLFLLAIGVANTILVHPVPGIIYVLLSLIYFPPTNVFLRQHLGFSIPMAVKIILGFIVIWFTLGISDLAEICGL